jgi:branched-chain amino acid aminotransferase
MVLEFPITSATRTVSAQDREAALANPGFGRHFTDHMARARWTAADGWHDARVGALEPYSLHPASAVLHYGQEIFEGLKAYRHRDGRIALFRPEKNAQRFAASARRLLLPELDPASFVASVEALLDADADWVPDAGSEASLYLRPYLFASEAFLGVRSAHEAAYGVIASPAGAYFPGGVAGITLWITTRYRRAAPGGTGAAKCGGNYAASLIAQLEAQENGCDQVLFTGGPVDAPVLEEAGTMNVFVVTTDGRLLTPPLGTILEGVTRDSVLTLAGEHGLRPAEEDIPLARLLDGCRDGTVSEVFAAGTAAVITPIVRFLGDGVDVAVNDAKPGAVSLAIRERLLGIQLGELPDPHGWLHMLDRAR